MNAANEMMKKRILVVDDNAGDTQLLKRFLEETDEFEVREENDPKSALSTAEQFEPHLILLDVLMPEMDGGELASSFKTHPKFKSVPIVFLTAKLTREQVAHCAGRIGGYPFLAKPIVLPEVAECLRLQLAAK